MREADFSEDTKRILAQRVNHFCSKCGCPTSGPQIAPSKALNIGVAAHITAASLGGPRYDPTLTQGARQSIENGIWLCQSCAKLIDNDTARFTTKVLQGLRAKAEADAFAAIGRAREAEHQLILVPKAPLPKADPARFSVALTHLANDRNRRIERLIVESLRTLSGVQVLVLDRTISPEGSVPEEAEREGHETARALLRVSSANVLIWGTVLSDGTSEAPSLYWATATVGMRSQQPFVPQDLRLPKMFWDDLALVLTLLVTTESAEFFARRGQRVAHELKPFLDRVEALLGGARNWNASIRNQIVLIAARAHQAIGIQTQSREHLLKSIALYRSALGNTTDKVDPQQRLSGKNGLGIALGALSSIETSPDALSEAAATFREILALSTPAPDAAVFQSNLGNALLKLGERENGTGKLHQAVAAYQEASKIWTRQQFPLDWATLESNLGYAFQLIGQREARHELLAASVTAYRRALEEWTRDLVPMYWASAQSNLGNTLKIIGEREAGTESLELATRAYREALGEQSVERDPLAWAELQNNLGAALMLIADRRGDLGSLRDAVSALRESLKVRTREAAPTGFASSSNNLGVALIRLGEWEDDPARFEEAVRAFRAALDVWTAENWPHRRSIATRNLGDALTALGKRRKSRSILKEAIEAYGTSPANDLGRAAVRYVLGEWEPGTELLEAAAEEYEDALSGNSADDAPFGRAGATFNFGNVLRLLGVRKKAPLYLQRALEHHALACRFALSQTPYWAFRAAHAAVEDLKLLQELSPANHQSVSQRYRWVAELPSKHDGHQIALMPRFLAAVAGTSGTVEPNWKLAPYKGDRIRDGSVVWENAGAQSYCLQCKSFLVPG